MKKTLLTLAFGLLISLTTMAQSKNEARAAKQTAKKIENIEQTMKLSDSEKETYTKLNIAYTLKHYEIKGIKESDPAKFKEELKANKKDLKTKLIAALGKERANKILAESKKK